MGACILLLCTKTCLKVYAIYYASEESMEIFRRAKRFPVRLLKLFVLGYSDRIKSGKAKPFEVFTPTR